MSVVGNGSIMHFIEIRDRVRVTLLHYPLLDSMDCDDSGYSFAIKCHMRAYFQSLWRKIMEVQNSVSSVWSYGCRHLSVYLLWEKSSSVLILVTSVGFEILSQLRKNR